MAKRKTAGNRYYQGPASDHFDGTRFFNPGGRSPGGLRDLLRWRLNGARAKWPAAWPSPHPQAVPDRRVDGDALRLTMVGHSTLLLQTGGVNILTDPVWSARVSPVSFAGPRRVNDPGIRFDDLPPIDVVLLSHGDYDHLHTPTLKALATRFPKARIGLPDGLESHGEKAGFTTVEHPLVGETVVAGRARLTAFPAVHGTRRNLLAKLDGDAYVWEIRLPGRSALFVGDSAHGPVFGEIGRKRGPYDLALVPIGAFEPSPLVADMHSTPEDAALILAELRATLGIGIHWGTFALSPEPLRDPADRFLAASDGNHRARVLRIGETLAIARRGN